MKKLFLTFFLCMLTVVTLTVSARAGEDIIKVGLYYGESALPSALLENTAGSGYDLGWFDGASRDFHQLVRLEEKRLTVTAGGAGVSVKAADTGKVLYQFDGSGGRLLGIQPSGGNARTLFQGCQWYGGFEFRRGAGGKLDVINVLDIDSYVKGVLPYEMSADWPLEALKAQAVCARTYALWQTRHAGNGFDVCNTTDCQVYRGTGSAGAVSDRAVEETAGIAAMYGGRYAETYYCSANGGASESSENVWSNPQPYLVGKEDPYERLTSIPDYEYTIRYSWAELSALLRKKGYSIGTAASAYVSRTTPSGNVAEVTIRDRSGKTVTLTKQDCRWTLGTKSMRFAIDGGGSAGGWSVNDGAATLSSLGGVYAVTGTGTAAALPGGDAYVITASGVSALGQPPAAPGGGSGITITGAGWGHGVGMSQYGAKAMAEQGHTYEDILNFYFTGITLERVD